MTWRAAGWVVVDKSPAELRRTVEDTLDEIGPMSGYAPAGTAAGFGDASFALGDANGSAALWDPIGKLAFGPRGEELRCALSRGTRLVAFQVNNESEKHGVRVYENGRPVRVVEIESGRVVRETGTALAVERAIAPRVVGRDEDWVFDLLEKATGVAFADLGDARYELLDLA